MKPVNAKYIEKKVKPCKENFIEKLNNLKEVRVVNYTFPEYVDSETSLFYTFIVDQIFIFWTT